MVCTCDENWAKKCIEFRVEGRRSVGRPRRTWLESVEAYIGELEIDREDVHDKRNGERMEVQLYPKTDYNNNRTHNSYFVNE